MQTQPTIRVQEILSSSHHITSHGIIITILLHNLFSIKQEQPQQNSQQSVQFRRNKTKLWSQPSLAQPSLPSQGTLGSNLIFAPTDRQAVSQWGPSYLWFLVTRSHSWGSHWTFLLLTGEIIKSSVRWESGLSPGPIQACQHLIIAVFLCKFGWHRA